MDALRDAWLAFADEVCRMRREDVQRRAAERVRLQDRPVDAVVAWMRQQPGWLGLDTPIYAIVNLFADAYTSVSVVQRVWHEAADEWATYKHTLSHHPRTRHFGAIAAHGFDTARIDAMYANVTLRNLKTNPPASLVSVATPLLEEMATVARHHRVASAPPEPVAAADDDDGDAAERMVRAEFTSVDREWRTSIREWKDGPRKRAEVVTFQLKLDSLVRSAEALRDDLHTAATKSTFLTDLAAKSRDFTKLLLPWLRHLLDAIPADPEKAINPAKIEAIREAFDERKKNLVPVSVEAYTAMRRAHLREAYNEESRLAAIAFVDPLEHDLERVTRLDIPEANDTLMPLVHAIQTTCARDQQTWHRLPVEPTSSNVGASILTHAIEAEVVSHQELTLSTVSTGAHGREHTRSMLQNYIAELEKSSWCLAKTTQVAELLSIDDDLRHSMHLEGTLVDGEKSFHDIACEYVACLTTTLRTTLAEYQARVRRLKPLRPRDLHLTLPAQWHVDPSTWRAFVTNHLRPSLAQVSSSDLVEPVTLLLRGPQTTVSFEQAARATFALYRAHLCVEYNVVV